MNSQGSPEDLVTSCAFLSHTVTTSQLKEELLDGEDYSFLQGASDQESNGSATFYIKQEPWGGSETRSGRDCFTGQICHHLAVQQAIVLGHFAKYRKVQFQIFQVGGKLFWWGGNFSIYKDGRFLCCIWSFWKNFVIFSKFGFMCIVNKNWNSNFFGKIKV